MIRLESYREEGGGGVCPDTIKPLNAKKTEGNLRLRF